MNRAGLLQETTAWMDTVDLALCLFIYEVCNDYQFEYLSGSDFVNFLNLKPTEREVIVRPKENLRICYMVFSDVCNNAATKENQDFRKSIDKAVENARRLKGTP